MSKLENETQWTAIEEKHSAVELLQLIKDVAYKYETQSYPFKVYIETFLNNVNVNKHSGKNIGEHPRLAKYIRLVEGDEHSTDAVVVKASLKKSTKAYFAYAFLSKANQRKYAKLLKGSLQCLLEGQE
eukprot:15311532-Ditylum_brightwellii.AAC.1